MRGAGSDSPTESGPYRFQNITYTAHACDHSGPGACAEPDRRAFVTGFKVWGYTTGFEILDSYWDCNVSAWTPRPAGGPGCLAFNSTQCTRDWVIRNNEFVDYKLAFILQGYARGFCDRPGRPVACGSASGKACVS